MISLTSNHTMKLRHEGSEEKKKAVDGARAREAILQFRTTKSRKARVSCVERRGVCALYRDSGRWFVTRGRRSGELVLCTKFQF
jgi:hypothetical protein